MTDRAYIDTVLLRVGDEVERATAKFAPFNSAHEGYAVILEVLDELWDDVKGNRGKDECAAAEAVQVAAMAVRYLLDIATDDVVPVRAPIDETANEWADWHAEQARSTNQPVSHEVELPDSGNEHRYCVPHDHADPSHDPDTRFTTAVKQADSVNPRTDAGRRLRNDLMYIRDTSTDGWARTKADTLLSVVLDAALAEGSLNPSRTRTVLESVLLGRRFTGGLSESVIDEVMDRLTD